MRLREFVLGAVAGVAATAAMTAWLGAAQALGLLTRQPPRIITEQTVPIRSETGMTLATIVAHLSYGAAAGAVWGLLAPRRLSGPIAGAVYGAVLWVCSYEGWVPAAGILPPAHRDNRKRVVTMLTGHLVYGTVLGVLARR